jgi:hypothetical protein
VSRAAVGTGARAICASRPDPHRTIEGVDYREHDGLVDELHLFVFPLAHGTGRRLFPDGGPVTKFTLAGSESYDSGVVHLTYMLAPGDQ